MGWYDFTTGITASDDVTTSETLSSSTQFVWVDATLGDVVIMLGAATDNERTVHTIKKIDSSEHTVTIDANSTETIDGEQTIVLKLQYSYITIKSDGNEWFIIGGEYVKMEDILERYLGLQQDTQEEVKRLLENIETHLSLGSGEELNKEESE